MISQVKRLCCCLDALILRSCTPSSAYSGGRDVVNFLSLIMNPRMAMNYHLFCLGEGKCHVQAAVIKARSANLPNRLRYHYYHIFENQYQAFLKTTTMTSKPQNIVFFHPDLGIGGAERLVIDAAVGLQTLGHKVTIFTSYCDPRHCFDEARDEGS